MTISSELARLLDAMHSTTPSEPALQRAELLLADQIAVSLKGTALAAGRTPPRRGHRPSATRWGDGARGFGPDIAFDNRRVADPLELTAGPECGAALVAAAEIADRSLKDLLASLCWAAELDRLLRGVFQKAVEQNGLHPPGLFAPAATAAAATWLLGHDLEATRHALHSSLCLLPMSPYVAFSSGSTAKELYGAWGQQMGLSLALMAGKGLTGPRNPFW